MMSQVSTVTAGCFTSPTPPFPARASVSPFPAKGSEPDGLGPELSNPPGSGPWSCPALSVTAADEAHPPPTVTRRGHLQPGGTPSPAASAGKPASL